NSAERTNPKRNPKWKFGPPTDHDQAREHKDDRRKCARCRGNGLDNVVLLDRGITEPAQDRHRNYRGRNRRRKCEPGLKPEVHVRGGKHERDNDPDDQTADGKLSAHKDRRIVWTRGNGQDERASVLMIEVRKPAELRQFGAQQSREHTRLACSFRRARRNASCKPTSGLQKFVMTRAPSPARECACAPRI